MEPLLCDSSGNPPPGISVLATFDLCDRSYEYEEVRLFRAEDGSLYWSYDSGCSCPVPFDSAELSPLRTEADWDSVERKIRDVGVDLTGILDKFHALRIAHVRDTAPPSYPPPRPEAPAS